MQMPFCDQCPVSNKCIPDLKLFAATTGNKRIPPESFCKEQFAEAGENIGDWYRNVLVNAVDNPTSLYPVFPELKDYMAQVEKEWRARNPNVQQEFFASRRLPTSATLMLTEKCNLACAYCYERFSGNVKPQSMSRSVIYEAVEYYLSTREPERISWDIIGGEVFAEFELLKYAVDTILSAYRRRGICQRRIFISLCSNGTLFTPEKRAWCEWLRNTIGNLELGISLDGVRDCHNACRNNSFDKVMENFGWWRKEFSACSIKGTISPSTLPYLYENVMFYVKELKLPCFYINPTFEGPWTDADAELYGEQLIKCGEYFLEHPEYNLLENSNLFMRTDLEFKSGARKQNWCGSGIHMRAIDYNGNIYPCLRGLTSKLLPLGNIVQGVDRNKLIPFYMYTYHNDNNNCQQCDIVQYCPSCVMQWVEDTGDMYQRSQKLCTMTRVRYHVSKWFSDTVKSLQEARNGGDKVERDGSRGR